MSSKSTSIFEPCAYSVPYGEFRLVITIHLSHSHEDPYTIEFLMDFTQVKLAANQKSKFAEVFYLQGGNNVIVGTEIIFDPNNELNAGVNKSILDSSFQSTGSTTTAPKSDFGKNLFVALKHISVSLPLKRIVNCEVELSLNVYL